MTFVFHFPVMWLVSLKKPWNLIGSFGFSVPFSLAEKKRCDLEQKIDGECDLGINRTAENQSHCKDNQWFQNECNKALKIAGMPRIKSGNVPSGKIIPNAALEKYGRLQFLTNCNCYINTLQVDNLPPFYVDVLKQWQMTKYSTRYETLLTYKQIIWNNQTILTMGKLVF